MKSHASFFPSFSPSRGWSGSVDKTLNCGTNSPKFDPMNVSLSGLNGLGGLVVMAPASRAEDPGFESCLRRDFFGSSHNSDIKLGTPVATLPGVWRYRVGAGTGWPGVSIL